MDQLELQSVLRPLPRRVLPMSFSTLVDDIKIRFGRCYCVYVSTFGPSINVNTRVVPC
jgi:hypothetical protein